MKSATRGLVLAFVVGVGAMLGVGSKSEPAEQGIDGVWTGERTNGMFGSMLSIKLTKSGHGVLYGGGGNIGFPGTFTYTLSSGQIRYTTNDTPYLTGTLRYDAAADVVVYQESAEAAKALRESGAPMLLQRETNQLRQAMLGSMIGATNYTDLMARLGRFLDSATNHPEWFGTNSPEREMAQQPVGGANGSQPTRSQTNSTSSAAGSRRSP